MIPLGEIDKLVKQKMDQIERKLRWNPSVKVGGLIYLLNIDQDSAGRD